jgi:hypothetical protein
MTSELYSFLPLDKMSLWNVLDEAFLQGHIEPES